MAKKDKNRELDWRETSLESFPKLNHSYYRETTRTLEAAGFSCIGDFKDIDATNPLIETCHRILTGDEGCIQAFVYHIRSLGIMSILPGSSPFKAKLLDLETEFTDGYFLITTNNVLVDIRNPAIEIQPESQASVEQLLQIHRQRVKTYLAENPAVYVWKSATSGAVIDSQRRQHRLRNSRSAQQDFKKRGKKKKPAIFPAGRDTTVTLAEDICRRKKTLLKILTLLIIALVLGYINMERDVRRHEKGKQLTIKMYKADYDEHQSERKPIPFSTWFLYSAFFNCIIFGLYEIGIKVGGSVLSNTLCKGKDSQPGSQHAAVFSMPQVVKSRLIGKVLVFVVLSVLVASYMNHLGSKKFDERKQLTYEEYMADYEAYKAKQTRPPTSFVGVLTLQLLLVGVLIGFYELGSKTAQAVTLVYYKKGLPIGTHMFLNFILWAIFGLGGIFFLVTIVKGGAFQLIALFAYFFIISKLFNLVFNAIPVICPKCGGKAYRSSARHLSFACRECQHVYRTSVSIGSK